MSTKPRKAMVPKEPVKPPSLAESLSAALPPGMNVLPAEGGRVRLELDPKAAPDSYRSIGGTSSRLANMKVVDEVLGCLPQTGDLTTTAMRIAGAMKMMEAFAPQDAVEAAIASQATALHLMTMETARRAMLPNQPSEIASKLRKDTANAARAMVEIAEALDRRRGKGGQQRIVVERVQVAPGGQAIVGAVTAGAAALPLGVAAPLALVEAGEGPGVEHAGSNS